MGDIKLRNIGRRIIGARYAAMSFVEVEAYYSAISPTSNLESNGSRNNRDMK